MRCRTAIPFLWAALGCLVLVRSQFAEVVVDPKGSETWTNVSETCWVESTNGVPALDHAAQLFGAKKTTPERCHAHCQSQGYLLSAVERGHECRCGNTIMGQAHAVNDEYCNVACSGDNSRICGGHGYMNIRGAYFNMAYDEEWTALACYEDRDANHRLLPFQPRKGQPDHKRTIGGCIQDCRGHGYLLAGLEYGRECFCGDVAPPRRYKGGQCDMPCAGDRQQYCGGEHSLLIFAFSGSYAEVTGNATQNTTTSRGHGSTLVTQATTSTKVAL